MTSVRKSGPCGQISNPHKDIADDYPPAPCDLPGYGEWSASLPCPEPGCRYPASECCGECRWVVTDADDGVFLPAA